MRKIRKNLMNKEFDRLVVTGVSWYTSNGKTYWICKCSCGNKTSATTAALLSGDKRSCGCLHIETAREQGHANRTHGYSTGYVVNNRFYSIWRHIKQRCYDTKHQQYLDYGGRGIKIYEEWLQDVVRFVDYVEKLPGSDNPLLTLDRINNDGNYEPSNLRWASRVQQANNRRPRKRGLKC